MVYFLLVYTYSWFSLLLASEEMAATMLVLNYDYSNLGFIDFFLVAWFGFTE